jgi:hypothetical protein
MSGCVLDARLIHDDLRQYEAGFGRRLPASAPETHAMQRTANSFLRSPAKILAPVLW